MIDFRLTETDQAHLQRTRDEALIARNYARHYDENEGEFPPPTLPEAEEFKASAAALPTPGPCAPPPFLPANATHSADRVASC